VVRHLLLHVLGLDSGSGPAYLWWSGAGSDLGELALIGALLAIVRRHNCHVRGCPRIGRHLFADQVTGVTYMLCGRHHPGVPGTVTREAIGAIHARNTGAEGT
jgi:hypothetical protein